MEMLSLMAKEATKTETGKGGNGCSKEENEGRKGDRQRQRK